ncbi:hypothetical protein N9N28_15065 [Rubripirellula amarantea]|nr:hypothetical protein [Rubripirellula amarantea]
MLIVIACCAAGAYGMLHNQVSYSVSPEYFTQFKFIQFEIDPTLPDRLGAAIVGWHGAWWMGMVISYLLIPLGLIIRGDANYFWGMLRVFCVVAFTAIAFGLVALCYAFVAVDATIAGEIVIYGSQVKDDVGFERVGFVHDLGYIGGYAGMATGALAIIWERRRSIEPIVESRA